MQEQTELFDITIIGGGPAGLYTAFYSGMRELKTKIIEAQDRLGGRMLLYPEKIIWDVGGVTPIRCEKLIEQLIQQGKTFDPTIVLGEQITGLEKCDDGTFILTALSGEKHHTRAIIMACGYGIRKMAKLEIEGADRYEVTNLYYTVQELEGFRGKRVLISGGGDSAVDWANELEPIAASITVVHRRDSFGGHERNVTKMKQSSVDVRTPFAVKALHSSNGETISRVTIQHVESLEEETIEVDAVIVNHGMRSDFGPVREWGLDIGEWNATVSEKMETNIPGIFGAGDFVEHGSKVSLIAGTFTDAVVALNSAKVYLEPAASPYAYVSSHNEVFKEKNKKLEETINQI
ncbi:NAD(P)/FAD-dependent oxidoreductase [Paenibacillus sp. GSMTC-2017]|uniref:NAD(P)/FAD-dependent oxidoreductase n=1 Tax=Paenibacillus sp. GSMTC-2017 TaxID=2794350 RepID=UPI0018D91BA1|nr:NAD(P)/FAD-dependent oxidoreductase [Paenibacillus sp. GSMTC-2017]MBH5318718.1 NAD(P)/FAD-dependent oxidoreductase [Paenibacillus sp. GSMTC-2017]